MKNKSERIGREEKSDIGCRISALCQVMILLFGMFAISSHRDTASLRSQHENLRAGEPIVEVGHYSVGSEVGGIIQ